MWTVIKTFLMLSVLSAIGWAAYVYGKDFVLLKSDLNFREVELTRGSLTTVIRSSGEVKPVVTISVGSFVSGPVKEVLVDFNEKVEKDQLMARIDSRTYAAASARDHAILATAQADLKRAEVLLEQAKAEEARSLAVQKENTAFVSAAELDAKRFNLMSVEAQREVALAAVKQAEATMQTSKENLEYTEIRAPVSGIVIDKKIEPGQTLASQFQIPELFRIAQDMDREMRIIVSVDEADIGTIVAASKQERPVRFTVDAYPDETFTGKVKQIRGSADARQAVVTYPVVVAVSNPDSRLLPGMTASVDFEVSEIQNALLVPNAALRVLPDPKNVVPDQRNAYRAMTDLKNRAKRPGAGSASGDKSKAVYKRMLWVIEGSFLRFIEVSIGENNDQYTAILEGPLKEGDRVVMGISSE